MLSRHDAKIERAKLAKMSDDDFIETVAKYAFLAARSSAYGKYDALCSLAYEVNPDLYDQGFKQAERMARGR